MEIEAKCFDLKNKGNKTKKRKKTPKYLADIKKVSFFASDFRFQL